MRTQALPLQTPTFEEEVQTSPQRTFHTSELGPVPTDWVLKPVGMMGEVRAGKALAVNGPGTLRPYLRTMNVFDGRIDVEDVLRMPMTDSEFALYELKHGDVLLNEGQSLELVGRCAMYRGEYGRPCGIQNALIRLRAKSGVSPAFATHLFRYCQRTGVFATVALQTTSVAHLGVSRFAKLELPWPQFPEQARIAEALDDADALIESLERLLAKKRDLKQAAMQQLLTGKTRLPGFEGEWKPTRLGKLGRTYGGLTGKTKAHFGHGNAKYVPFMNVMSNVVIDKEDLERVCVGANEQQNAAQKGDLFFNGSSETPEEVGMCSYLADDLGQVFVNSFCFGFRFYDVSAANGLFLAYYLRSHCGRELLRSLAQGATRYNLSKRALMGIVLRLPKPNEQTAIATVLQDMDAEEAAIEGKLRKVRKLKVGMMQELLTGKIRLV